MMKKVINLFLAYLFVITFSADNGYAQEYHFENLLESPKIFTLKHGIFYHCSDKEAVPFTLPKDAIGFFYEFTVLPVDREMNEEAGLLSKVTAVEKELPLADMPFLIKTEKSEKFVNTYLIADWQNIYKFEHCQYRKHPIGGSTHADSEIGYFENTGEAQLFMGFENPYGRCSKMKIKVEIVAVFSEMPN